MNRSAILGIPVVALCLLPCGAVAQTKDEAFQRGVVLAEVLQHKPACDQFEISATAGLPAAQRELGICYLKGVGRKTDATKAAELLGRAAPEDAGASRAFVDLLEARPELAKRHGLRAAYVQLEQYPAHRSYARLRLLALDGRETSCSAVAEGECVSRLPQSLVIVKVPRTTTKDASSSFGRPLLLSVANLGSAEHFVTRDMVVAARATGAPLRLLQASDINAIQARELTRRANADGFGFFVGAFASAGLGVAGSGDSSEALAGALRLTRAAEAAGDSRLLHKQDVAVATIERQIQVDWRPGAIPPSSARAGRLLIPDLPPGETILLLVQVGAELHRVAVVAPP